MSRIAAPLGIAPSHAPASSEAQTPRTPTLPAPFAWRFGDRAPPSSERPPKRFTDHERIVCHNAGVVQPFCTGCAEVFFASEPFARYSTSMRSAAPMASVAAKGVFSMRRTWTLRRDAAAATTALPRGASSISPVAANTSRSRWRRASEFASMAAPSRSRKTQPTCASSSKAASARPFAAACRNAWPQRTAWATCGSSLRSRRRCVGRHSPWLDARVGSQKTCSPAAPSSRAASWFAASQRGSRSRCSGEAASRARRAGPRWRAARRPASAAAAGSARPAESGRRTPVRDPRARARACGTSRSGTPALRCWHRPRTAGCRPCRRRRRSAPWREATRHRRTRPRAARPRCARRDRRMGRRRSRVRQHRGGSATTRCAAGNRSGTMPGP